MNQKQKQLLNLKNKLVSLNNTTIDLLQSYAFNLEGYIETFHLEQFNRNRKEQVRKNLKRAETVFDKNHETLMRNFMLNEEKTNIQVKLKQLKDMFDEIGKFCEEDNNFILENNNKLISEMKKIEEEIIGKEKY